MVTLDLSRVDRKAQGPLELESYLFPFGPTPSHILKSNWNGLKASPIYSVIYKERNIQNFIRVFY